MYEFIYISKLDQNQMISSKCLEYFLIYLCFENKFYNNNNKFFILFYYDSYFI